MRLKVLIIKTKNLCARKLHRITFCTSLESIWHYFPSAKTFSKVPLITLKNQTKSEIFFHYKNVSFQGNLCKENTT